MAAEAMIVRRRHWRKLRQLSWSDRRLLVQALFLLPAFGLAVRCIAFQSLRGGLMRFVPRRPASASIRPLEDHVQMALRCASLVRIAARRTMIRGSCLQQSLTLWWLLTRRGTPAQLHVGVRTVSGKLEAHAWVEVAGQVISDRGGVRRRYAAFDQPLIATGSI